PRTVHRSPGFGSRSTRAARRPSSASPRPTASHAYAPGQSSAAQTNSDRHRDASGTHVAATRSVPGTRAREDAQAVPGRAAAAAHEAVRERARLIARGERRALRVGERDRRGRLELEGGRTRLGDEDLAVPDADAVAQLDAKLPPERRRRAERHLRRLTQA